MGVMKRKLVSEYSNKKRKRSKTSMFGKVLAYCYQNNLKKPQSINDYKIINIHNEDSWHQEKMHYISGFVKESDIGKTIFWLKGKTIIAGYQISLDDIKQNQYFMQAI